jgi:hypothetical protein
MFRCVATFDRSEELRMSHSIPNHLQVVLLYDSADAIDLNALQAAFLKSELNAGYTYNVVEANGRTFFRCFGGRDSQVMVIVEWVDRPGERAKFDWALSCVFNQISAPDAAALIERHRGLLLINVHHGALSQSHEVQTLLAQMGVGQAGQSLPQYQERLRVMGLLAAMATQISKPTLSHWTHTDLLARPHAIKDFMCDTDPNPLHVYPLPFRGPGTTQEEGIAGLVTFGAAAFIGREIRVRPTEVPWNEAYHHALCFICLAIRKNGYVIADGDTFSDDSESFCYRVHHTAEPLNNAGTQIPCYELEPLLNKQHGFQSPEFVTRDRIVDIDNPQPEYGAQLKGRAGREAIAEWKVKRQRAERAGGNFIVKAKVEASGGGTFGKRQTGAGASAAKGGSTAGWLAKTFNVRRDKE